MESFGVKIAIQDTQGKTILAGNIGHIEAYVIGNLHDNLPSDGNFSFGTIRPTQQRIMGLTALSALIKMMQDASFFPFLVQCHDTMILALNMLFRPNGWRRVWQLSINLRRLNSRGENHTAANMSLFFQLDVANTQHSCNLSKNKFVHNYEARPFVFVSIHTCADFISRNLDRALPCTIQTLGELYTSSVWDHRSMTSLFSSVRISLLKHLSRLYSNPKQMQRLG